MVAHTCSPTTRCLDLGEQTRQPQAALVSRPHLGDGIESIPALLQNHGAGVIEEADQARDQASKVAGVVGLGAGAVHIEDDRSSLPHAHLRAARGFQQILNDDAVPSVILY